MGINNDIILFNAAAEDELAQYQGPFNITDNGITTNVYINIFTGTVKNTSTIFTNLNSASNASYSIKGDVVSVQINGVELKPFDIADPQADANVIICPMGQDIVFATTVIDIITAVGNKSAIRGWAPGYQGPEGGGSDTKTHFFM